MPPFDILPQSIDPLKGPVLAPQKSQAQVTCESKGGRWDAETKTCILPKTAPLPEREIKDIEITDFKDSGVKGVKTPEGRSFLAPLSPEEIESIRAGEQRLDVGRETPLVIKKAGETQVEFEQAQAIEVERERLIREETPVRRELDPSFGTGEQFPVLGGMAGAIRRTLGKSGKGGIVGILSKNGFKEAEYTPEILRTAALTEIERQEIERGLTDNEKFGELIEGIPLIGSLASKYAGGLIETPSENAREVKSNILKEKRRIANIETNVKLGYLPVSVAREQIIDIENNIQRLESRIRLLVSHSPELRFNSDYVNTVETEILATREKAFQAKLNILTGAISDPTEIDLLLKLQELQLNDEGTNLE